MVENREFREENKFQNWFNGETRVDFNYKGLNLAETMLESLGNILNNGFNPENAFVQSYDMHTSAFEGSIQSPWFGEAFDGDTFETALNYRYLAFLKDWIIKLFWCLKLP